MMINLGRAFPDMSEPYNRRLIDLGQQLALKEHIKVHQGVYIAVTGPCLETAAEYRFMRMIGADVVGMSTVPEVIVACHAGLSVFGISCVTDMCLPDALHPVNVEEIIATAQKAEPQINLLVKRMIETLK